MQTNQSDNTKNIIDSALALTAESRLAVLNAIHVSLADTSVDHGPQDEAEPVQAAWSSEIKRRIDDIDNGVVQTVPAHLAEEMIRGDAKPNV